MVVTISPACRVLGGRPSRRGRTTCDSILPSIPSLASGWAMCVRWRRSCPAAAPGRCRQVTVSGVKLAPCGLICGPPQTGQQQMMDVSNQVSCRARDLCQFEQLSRTHSSRVQLGRETCNYMLEVVHPHTRNRSNGCLRRFQTRAPDSPQTWQFNARVAMSRLGLEMSSEFPAVNLRRPSHHAAVPINSQSAPQSAGK